MRQAVVGACVALALCGAAQAHSSGRMWWTISPTNYRCVRAPSSPEALGKWAMRHGAAGYLITDLSNELVIGQMKVVRVDPAYGPAQHYLFISPYGACHVWRLNQIHNGNLP